ncbi:MAG: beta strand repeat-containing protein, partial [Rubripirellula sp.]
GLTTPFDSISSGRDVTLVTGTTTPGADFGNRWLGGYDLGDAPVSFGTLTQDMGPAHRFVSGVSLGSGIDLELDGDPGTGNSDTDADDGVTFTSLITPGNIASLDVELSTGGHLAFWIDFNANNSFDIEERFQVALPAGTDTLFYIVPATAVIGPSVARFRFSTNAAGIISPLGLASDGEVEDYAVVIEADNIDFGDAPTAALAGGGTFVSDYPTRLADDGARHIASGPSLGTGRDVETVGLTSAAASGDDMVGSDDEDGVTFAGTVTASQSAPAMGSVNVNLQNADPLSNKLDAWIDFNRDGDWNDPGEQIFTNLDLDHTNGVQNLQFLIPQDNGTNLSEGLSFARFRVSTAGNLAVTGLAADGEVEDLPVMIGITGLDYGDAPTAAVAGAPFVSDYPTTLVQDGARHANAGATLGPNRDIESTPDISSATAEGDDSDGLDDEDGVFLGTITSTTLASNIGTVRIDLQNADPTNNFLNAWIDWNRDGDWDDADEQILTDADLGTINGVQFLNYTIPQDIGPNVEDGTSYARFRLSTATGLGVTGPASDGEVEDHLVTIETLVGDLGDAPTAAQAGGGTFVSDYPTLVADDGARHAFAPTGPILGSILDIELDGQPAVDALGDDVAIVDDEDGTAALVLSPLFASYFADTPTSLSLDVSSASGASGLVSAWVDWNADGDWSDPGEQILTDEPVVVGTNTLNYIIPQDTGDNVRTGTTYARFRVSTDAGLSFTGVASDGEVEDTQIFVGATSADFGDAPTALLAGAGTFVSDYPVTIADDGARHNNVGASFGSIADLEIDGVPSVDADSDDTTGTDDEDGVLLSDAIATTLASAVGTVTVDLQNADPVNNFVNAWIDWNRDGDWNDADEQIFTDFDLGTTNGIQVLNYTIPQDVGANVEEGVSYARFRLSNATGVGVTGAVDNGEVEDVAFQIVSLVGDLGDAPTAAQAGGGTFVSDYPTTVADDGARHANVPGGPTLGSGFDIEADGTPSANADGDGADEDGIVLAASYTASSLFTRQGTITVDLRNAGATNILNGWIDWNRDGDWLDPGEQILTDADLGTVDAVQNITFNIPPNSSGNVVDGTSYARFRLSTVGGLGVQGPAIDGEVEDYQVEILTSVGDFGDAPTAAIAGGGTFLSDYPTTLADNGAVHDASGATLGAVRDSELDGLPSTGLGDDLDNQDDEDGISFSGSVIATTFADESGTVSVDLQNASAVANLLDAWIDWNRDGDWLDPNEQILTSFDLGLVNGTQAVTFVIPQDMGGNVVPGVSYARFRLSEGGGLGPDGQATDGEVEDHQILIESLIGDLGDAPTAAQSGFAANYPTTVADNGAVHAGIGPRLGSRDLEADGLPDANATGDDSALADDEDGVTFGTFVVDALAATTFDITVDLQNADAASNLLNAWIDWNQDGDWDDAGEQVANNADLGTANGSVTVTLDLPQDTGANVLAGTTYARFRVNTGGSLTPGGATFDGEVEDYEVQVVSTSYDYGDAPAPYPTLAADSGARHTATGPQLGPARDGEFDGTPDPMALGDDNAGDDEDGVIITGILTASGLTTANSSLTVHLQNADPVSNLLNGWIDWNQDGDWDDPDEQVFTDRDLGTTNGPVPLTFAIPQDVGTNVIEGNTFARFRVSTGSTNVTGNAADGEVEDYLVQVDSDAASVLNPLDRIAPLGSLIVGSLNNTGILTGAADNDMFTVDLEGGETVSGQLSVEPGAIATLQILGVAGAIATSPAPGEPAVLPPTLIPGDGTFTVLVRSTMATNYNLDFLQNTALESLVGDSDVGNELAIDDSEILLTNDVLLAIPSSRYAVFGSATAGDVDVYELDLTGRVGESVDVVIAGQASVDFSSELLELLAPDGSVVATGVNNPGGPFVTNYDLGIIDFIVPSDGVYSIRVTSAATTGDYAVVVTDSVVFDTEPNENIPNTRDLSTTDTALGFLDATTDALDVYTVDLVEGQAVTIGTATPFDGATSVPLNDLDVDLQVLLNGQMIAMASNSNPDGKNAEVTFIAQVDGTYEIQVSAASGLGEYLLSVALPIPTVSLSVDKQFLAEGGDVATFTAKLSNLFDRDVTVELIFGGTATIGVTNDYQRSAPRIVIPAGEESGEVQVITRSDTQLEANETIVVEIDTVSFGTELETQTATTTILDDEFLTPIITTPAASPNNLQFIPISVDFGATVSSFDETDLLVSNSSVMGFVDQGNGVFSFFLVPTGDSTLTLDIAIGAALDAGNKQTLGATRFTIDSDRTGPTPLITGPASPHNGDPFSVNIDFGEPVSTFQATDIVVGNGSVTSFTNLGNGQFLVTIDAIADGPVTVNVPAGSVTDGVGNDNPAASQFNIVIDTGSLGPVITGPAGPSNLDPFLVDIDFGETFNNFVLADLNVTNGSVLGLVDNGNGLFTARIDANADGNVSVRVPANVATDLAGNNNVVSNVFNLLVDTTSPTIFGTTGVTVEGDTKGGADPSNPAIAAFLSNPIAFDNLDPTVPVTHDAPPIFPIGDTVVTFTAVDDAGNIGTVLETVSVIDTTAPVGTPPADTSVEGDTTGGASIANVDVAAFLGGLSGVDDIVDATLTITNNAPSVLPVGDN